MTIDELIAVARRYHSSPGDLSRYTSAEYSACVLDAPETRALRELQESAIERRGGWESFLKSMRGVLAFEFHWPHLWHDACYIAEFELPPGSSRFRKSVRVQASFIAPLYYICEEHIRVKCQQQYLIARLDEPTDEAAEVFAEAHRAMRERFGLQRFPPELADVIVSDIEAGNLMPGQVTLLHALFSPHLDEVWRPTSPL